MSLLVAHRPNHTPKRRVVVIDDDEDTASFTAQLLRGLGYETRFALDGPRGIELAIALDAGVVVCDIGLLGGMDGLEVARVLRSELPSAHIIALTGFGREHYARTSHDDGFDAHLLKPINLDALHRLIQRRWATA